MSYKFDSVKNPHTTPFSDVNYKISINFEVFNLNGKS